MSVSDPLDAQCLSHIAAGLNLPLPSVRSVLTLLDEGSTVPFIARYRKEATGNLDEVQIRDVAEKVDYFRELLQRRETVLTSIAEQGKLTDDLKASILASMDRNQLEDLYLPYKPRRRTKATSARERGLEPLADYIWKQKPSSLDLIALTESLLDPAREVATVEAALEGARHIVAERISEDAEVRKAARHLMFEEGIIASRGRRAGKIQNVLRVSRAGEDHSVSSHASIRRGEAGNVLYWLIELDELRVLSLIRSRVMKANGDWTPHVTLAIEDCGKRLLNSSIQGELRLELKRRSDTAAIEVFRENLEHLLLAAPAGPIGVLGIDPGLRTGCRLAVVNETGKFLADDVIYPHTGRTKEAVEKLATLIARHGICAIAIGNGTASRETNSFVRDFLKEKGFKNIFQVTVSESGASVYSASEIARQEFPTLPT